MRVKNFNKRKIRFGLALCLFLISIVPKILVTIQGCMDPFANSLIALGIETQATGHIRSIEYKVSGTWQSHANFISLRVGAVSFLVIMSSITGISIPTVAHLPIIGIMFIIISFILGRRFGGLFLGLLFAISFGFMWHYTLTSTAFSYQSYGDLLQLIILFILTWKLIDQNRLGRDGFVCIMLLFLALFQIYYMAECLTAVIILSIFIFSFLFKRQDTKISCTRYLLSLVLYCLIVFLAFDIVMYEFMEGLSVNLLFETISSYFSYVLSVIFGKISATQQYRPYTHPISKYLDLISVMANWIVILWGIFFYLFSLKKKRLKYLTEKDNLVFIMVLSLTSTFFVRGFIYAVKGKISIGWPLETVITYAIIQIFWIERLKTKLKYLLPIVLICMSIARFSLIWTDQSMAMTANYSSLARPSANWIGNNLHSGSIVSSNQLSAEIFAIIAESGKADYISVNQFGCDVGKIFAYNVNNLTEIFLKRQYNYLVLSRSFENQPVFGGFWGPYIPPLGERLEVFANYSCISRVYDNTILIVYWFSNAS